MPPETLLNLGECSWAREWVWQHGTLPPRLLEYPHLEVVHASHLGLIYIDAWITKLGNLREIYVSGNEITTWPHHLLALTRLRVLVMDGNPCLDMQLRKSLLFASAFFNGTPKTIKHLPSDEGLVQGPEWKPAVLRRSTAHQAKGTYCGGIYRLAQPPKTITDDFITTMGPSRLDVRWGKPVPDYQYTAWPCTKHQAEQSCLLLYFLRGISALNKLEGPRKKDEHHHVDDFCFDYFCFETLPTKQQLRAQLVEFIRDEHNYLMRLEEVLQVFLSHNAPSVYVRELDTMFGSFAEIFLLHRNCISIIDKGFRLLLSENKSAMLRCCSRILRALEPEQFRCYEEYGTGYISSQWRLWCYINHENLIDEGFTDSSERLSEWFFKQATDNPRHTLGHASFYLSLPLKRFREYINLIDILCKLTKQSPPKQIIEIRKIYSRMCFKIQNARRKLGIDRLCTHYHLNAKIRPALSQYQWDALVEIRHRIYLEKGVHKLKTSDCIVQRSGRSCSMSSIHEVFNPKDRLIRLIRIGYSLQIWDETVGQLVCTLDMGDVVVTAPHKGDDILTIVFKPVDEVNFCRLLSFSSIDEQPQGEEPAFIAAVNLF